MKKTISFISIGFIFLFTLLLPTSTEAHGGFEKITDNVIVYISQSPTSPLVGEKVKVNFVFRDKNNQILKNLPVKLTLIDTFAGDESKDKAVYTGDNMTDANGSFDFEYTFEKENYFDVDLGFVDPQTKKNEEIGFLIQPRQEAGQKRYIIGIISGIVIGFLLGKIYTHNLKRKQSGLTQ